jgi:hypothetical protein
MTVPYDRFTPVVPDFSRMSSTVANEVAQLASGSVFETDGATEATLVDNAPEDLLQRIERGVESLIVPYSQPTFTIAGAEYPIPLWARRVTLASGRVVNFEAVANQVALDPALLPRAATRGARCFESSTCCSTRPTTSQRSESKDPCGPRRRGAG